MAPTVLVFSFLVGEKKEDEPRAAGLRRHRFRQFFDVRRAKASGGGASDSRFFKLRQDMAMISIINGLLEAKVDIFKDYLGF